MITKIKIGIILNLQNSDLLRLSLATEEIFQMNGQNQLMGNLPVVDFRSQQQETSTPTPLPKPLKI